MNTKKIKELAQILSDENLTAIEVTEGDSTIRVERNQISHNIVGGAVAAMPIGDVSEPQAAHVSDVVAQSDGTLHEFKSPIFGVYYSASSPEAKPFLEEGKKVKKGDVVCIIEAMKVLNEITADKDGTVAQICVQNGAVVEYGKVLFKIR